MKVSLLDLQEKHPLFAEALFRGMMEEGLMAFVPQPDQTDVVELDIKVNGQSICMEDFLQEPHLYAAIHQARIHEIINFLTSYASIHCDEAPEHLDSNSRMLQVINELKAVLYTREKPSGVV